MPVRRGARVVSALVTLAVGVPLSVATVAHPAAASASDPEPTRILLVGDSMTQGSAGDWTWRYRLWQHLTEHAVDVDLVGYRDDLRDEIGKTFGDQHYLDPAFDRDHAARWGMALSDPDVSGGDLVQDHQPDVVVVMLGDNDLSAGATGQQAADRLQDFVTDLRAADPVVDVVLVNDPRGVATQPQSAAYNAEIEDLAASLSTTDAPVVVADAASGFDLDGDTYDWAHPNARGELKIAAAVADALSVIGVGPPADRPLSDVPRGPRLPPVLSATATEGGADLSWVRSPGAETTEVYARDVTAGETGFQRVATRDEVSGTAHTVGGLAPGHTVQLRTRPFKGFWGAETDAWSNPVEVVVPEAPSASGPPGPVKVLLIGDSVTQGSSGDWTWRYRLWKHLQATYDAPVDFVGPRDDLHDILTDQNGNDDYIDPGFDRDHAARWGMTLSYADTPIDELVEDYQPDVVVEMLGTNDLLFLQQSPAQVEQNIENFVTAAQSADPDVDIVLSEITQTWFTGATELNALLADGAAELDTAGSTVVLADTDNGYTSAAHTFDDSHPNARGEMLIAAAVADSLAGLGIGTPPVRPLPTVPLGPRIPSVLHGSVSGRAADLTWTRSPGAASVQLSVRDVTAGTGWTVIEDRATGTTWVHHAMPVGHTMQFRVVPRKGWFLAQPDVASVVELRVPKVPSRTRVQVVSRASGRAVLTWRAAPRATHYRVELRRVGRGGWRTVAEDWARTRLVRRALRSGATYAVRVTPANATGAGPRSEPVRFTVPRRR